MRRDAVPNLPPSDAPRRAPRAILIVAGLLVLIVLAQFVVRGLATLQPEEPQTLFTSAPSLADPRAPVLGAARGDVVIYLFSDYSCGVCRRMHPALRDVLAEDAGVKLVYRDWPILSERSRRAARLALASVAQGRHAAFDDALMRRGGALDETALRAAAARAGADWQRLQADSRSPAITALLADTDHRARLLGFAGTPTMVVGPYLVSGGISRDRLRELVRSARPR